MNFYDHLKANENNLNELEEKILRYIISQKELIEKITVKKIAERYYVAPNTIVRLSQKLGFRGYMELKNSFLLTLQQSQSLVEQTSLDEQIIKTKELLNDNMIEQIVDKISTSETIAFFSSGLSKFPCDEMNEKLKILGKKTEVFNERHVMQYCAKKLTNKDLVFAVSVSGETKVSIEAVTIAKSRGSVIVTLTGLSKNTLSKLADYAIYTMDNKIYYDDMDLTSRITFYYVFHVIFEKYLYKMQKDLKEHQRSGAQLPGPQYRHHEK